MTRDRLVRVLALVLVGLGLLLGAGTQTVAATTVTGGAQTESEAYCVTELPNPIGTILDCDQEAQSMS